MVAKKVKNRSSKRRRYRKIASMLVEKAEEVGSASNTSVDEEWIKDILQCLRDAI